jgi:hydroxymethylpyrimidine/phosphomethylpyrimidine kinase / thiaminase
MLASGATIEIVAERLGGYDVKTIVLDPVCPQSAESDCNAFSSEEAHHLPQVMVSTSGAELLPRDAVRILREKLLPMTSLLTPNIPEAILLLRDVDQYAQTPSNLEEAKLLAKQVHGLGPKAVLLKGGHMPLARDYTKSTSMEDASLVVDILYDGSIYNLVEAEYSTCKNTHGTGCSLASAIAANMACGKDMVAAVKDSCRYVEAGIRTSKTLGKGNGPINHFHSAYHLPFAP